MDIEALRKKLEESKEKSQRGGSKADFWKPNDGRNVIRILPAKDRGNDFYAEALVHYNVGPKNRMVTCGKTDGNSCVICDYVDKLFKTGDDSDTKLAKKMKAKTRHYFNVIDRSVQEGEEGYGKVLVYGSGVGVFQDVLGIIVDPDYGDITNSENGRDVIITKSGKMLDTEYKIQARPVQNSVGIKDWEANLNELARYKKSRSSEDMIKILSGEDVEGEGSGDDNKDNKDERSNVSSKPASKQEPEQKEEKFDEKAADDIENEIQAMLNRRKK